MLSHMERYPVTYYFYDTDETGTAEYDLSGDAYRDLMDLCGKYCAIVSFLDRTHDKKWDVIEAYRIPIPECVSAVYRRHYALDDTAQIVHCFRVTDDVLHFLSEHADSVFERKNGVEDLAFFREDGTAFFTSIAHEGECILMPRDSEDMEALVRSGPWTTNRWRVY